ncbi:hypothetical protein BGP76_09415 [Reichenbachiella sp. MSK19-1]|nr:hypothetical protein BGP76_09415 [Reichenbachiella sp. MSK19-1]
MKTLKGEPQKQYEMKSKMSSVTNLNHAPMIIRLGLEEEYSEEKFISRSSFQPKQKWSCLKSEPKTSIRLLE